MNHDASEVSSLTDHEIGWLAGIMDGEGCIGVYRNKRNGIPANHQLRLSVSNTDPLMIYELKRLCGGRTRMAARKANPNWHSSWLWDLGGRRAITLLRTLAPYHISKREQAQLAISFIPVSPGTRERTPIQKLANEELRLKLRALKGHKQQRWLVHE